MAEPEMIHDIAAAEAARAQADARRKRILEKANKRLGVVSGEQVLAEEDKEASASKAARIRAARQRRYGKKAVDPASEVSKEEGEEEIAAPPTESIEEKNIKEETSPEKIAATEEHSHDDAEEEDAKLENIPDAPSAEDDSPEDSGVTGIDEPKKKYLGVARMRRHMIKKKKMEEDQPETVEIATSSPALDATDIDPKLLSPDPLKVRTVPIYMHILTVFLLFFAGMDISLQQYHQSILVHSKLAIQEFGVPLIHRSFGAPSKVKTLKSSLLQAKEEEMFNPDGSLLMDEFQEEVIEPSIQNIDPLFRVDLDELTKGPGIMRQLARGAVAVHRSILWLLYLLPLSILQSILSIPQALFRSPPTLCLVALSLRHIVGKAILGAGIPEPTKDNDKSNSIDVVAMAKNFVTNFLTTNFPIAVGLYEAFTHVRADMYVLLCGVFSGLVWVHLVNSVPTLPVDDVAEMNANDEL